MVYGEHDLYHSVGDRPDQPTLVVGTDARGADQWGYGQSGASNFETWADVARRFKLDPTKTAIGGFSSGAYSANKLSLTFPDVFGKAFICDGLDVAPSFPTQNGVADELPVDTTTVHEPGSRISELLPSRRNQPVMEWAGSTDDFIPYNITRKRADLYAAGDYDYEFITWHGDRLRAPDDVQQRDVGRPDRWLGDMKRVVDPVRVTYVRNPLMDDPGAGLVGDRAYWVSGIETRDRALGTIDVTSGGFDIGPAATVRRRTTENESIASDGVNLGSGYDQPDRRYQVPRQPVHRGSTATSGRPGASPRPTRSRSRPRTSARSSIDSPAGQGDLRRQARRDERRAAVGHAARLRRSGR